MNHARPQDPGLRPRSQAGFTLIELMIVIAVIAIILTLAIPMYTDYTTRTKIAEGLNVAKGAKTAVASTCTEDRTIGALTPSLAGYNFEPSTYVQSVNISGPCTAPEIIVQTLDTGASPDPTLTITGSFTVGDGRITWLCTSSAPNYLLPDNCRS